MTDCRKQYRDESEDDDDLPLVLRKSNGYGGNRSANRKRKNPTDVGDYFKAEESDVGEIKVKTDTGEIISLEVKGSDTIGSVKLKIQAARRTPFNEQELIFDEKVLENINTLANLRVKKQSTLTVMRRTEEWMELFVNHTLTKKTLNLLVKPTYTIAQVKQLIQSNADIRSGEQVLMFNNMVLGESGTLFDFHINNKSTLTLMCKLKGSMQISIKIFIKILTEDETIIMVPLKVKPSDTINNIKSKIQEKVDIPRDEQELFFNDMVLHDMDILADCNINTESTLTLVRISTGNIRIFIMTLTGKTVTLDVKRSDTIYNVKAKFFDKEGISPSHQKLSFNRSQLDDSPTLGDYHIHNESIFQLV